MLNVTMIGNSAATRGSPNFTGDHFVWRPTVRREPERVTRASTAKGIRKR